MNSAPKNDSRGFPYEEPRDNLPDVLTNAMADSMDPADYGCSPPSAEDVLAHLDADGWEIRRKPLPR